MQVLGSLGLALLPLLLWRLADAELPQVICAGVAGLLGMRLYAQLRRRRPGAWSCLAPSVSALILVLALWAMLQGQITVLLYYPVLVNGLLLGVFAGSLRGRRCIVEVLASLREPQLDERAVQYTRAVTRAWCGFFAVNGGVALLTCLHGDLGIWALYNGCISYLLLGLMLAGEYGVRRIVRARQARW